MGRRLLYPEKMEATFTSGTFLRIDDVLSEKESRTDLVRIAVEREILAREMSALHESVSAQSMALNETGLDAG